jgi:hypothetical protein
VTILLVSVDFMTVAALIGAGRYLAKLLLSGGFFVICRLECVAFQAVAARRKQMADSNLRC